MSIIKIYLNIPLRKVPFGGLFRFNNMMYRRGIYVHSSRVYICYHSCEHDPGVSVGVLFSPSEIVSYYKCS